LHRLLLHLQTSSHISHRLFDTNYSKKPGKRGWGKWNSEYAVTSMSLISSPYKNVPKHPNSMVNARGLGRHVLICQFSASAAPQVLIIDCDDSAFVFIDILGCRIVPTRYLGLACTSSLPNILGIPVSRGGKGRCAGPDVSLRGRICATMASSSHVSPKEDCPTLLEQHMSLAKLTQLQHHEYDRGPVSEILHISISLSSLCPPT
jgi:hypothetical protein